MYNNLTMKKMMKYGYEKNDDRGNLIYPMCPVQEEEKIIACYIIGNGYAPVSPTIYGTEEECRKACDIHNQFYGWTKGEIESIFFKSITGQFPDIELTKEQIRYMIHAIGYQEGKEGENLFYVYQRNFFAGSEHPLWEDLVGIGIASKCNSAINPKETVYSLTSRGIKLLSKHFDIQFFSEDEYQKLPPDIVFG